MKRFLLFLALLCVLRVQAQQYSMEYWFDQRYADRNTAVCNTTEWQMQLDVSQLNDGLHTLYLHLRDTAGHYSPPQSFLFYKSFVTDSTGYNMAYSCWFDEDYTAQQTGTLTNGNMLLEVGNLKDGLHTMNMQIGNVLAAELHSYLFYKVSASDSISFTNIAYTCWIDENHTTLQTGALGDGNILLDVSNLQDGLHTMNMQIGDGLVAELHSYLFYKVSAYDSTGSANLAYICWFDNDNTAYQTGPLSNGIILLDVSSLTDGLHTVNMQIGDGLVAELHSYLFYKVPVYNEASYSLDYTCWFDQEFDNRQSGTLSNGTFLLEVSDLGEGLHTMNMQIGTGAAAELHSYLFYKAPVYSEEFYALDYTCWFDQEFDNRQSGTLSNGTFLLEVSDLGEGLHTMNMQIGTGAAAELHSYLFYKITTSYALADTAVLRYHYAIDGRQKEPIEVSPQGGAMHLMLDVADVPVGLHTLSCFLMTSDGSSSTLHTAFFYKTLNGGNGINRYEYWLNGNWDERHTVDVPKQDTLQLITLLPVDTLPLRSMCFEFNPNNGSPVIYAKNDITFRFWNEEYRFASATKQYVDENVMQEVVADTLERDTTKVIPAPNNNAIHWFKLAAGTGDSLSFHTDRRCTMQLYAPSGAMVFHTSGDTVLTWHGCHAWEDGDYYLAVHDAEGNGNVAVSYQWVYRYAVLDRDIYEVGNAHQSFLSFYGNGFDSITHVGLCHTPGDTLWAELFHSYENTFLRALFQFDSTEIGIYNIIFDFNGEIQIVNNGLNVVPFCEGELLSTLEHPLGHTAQDTMSFTIKVVNTGNISAISVPVQIRFTTTYQENVKTKITITSKGSDNKTKQCKLNGGINPFTDGLAQDDARLIQSWIKDNFEDDLYFYQYIDENENVTRANILFVDVDPQSTMMINIAQPGFRAHQTVEIDAYVPKYNRYMYQQLKEESIGETTSNETTDEQHPIRDWWCDHHDKVECIADVTGTVLQYTGEFTLIGYAISGASTISSAISKRTCNQEQDVDWTDVASPGLSVAQTLVDNSISTQIVNVTTQELGASSLIQKLNNFRKIKTVNNWGFGIVSAGFTIHNCIKAWWPRGEKHMHGEFEHIAPFDPNEITGYVAESGSLCIKDEIKSIGYIVEFENDSIQAMASARHVVVRDTLDGSVFDLNSFAASSFAIGEDITTINSGQNFIRTVDMRPEINVIAQVELDYQIDSTFAVATWTFSSLDPMTLQPTVADTLGFLSVGSTGEVNFTINRKANLSDSTLIDNRAWITFDNEDPIATSTWRNIIDVTPPTSHIDSFSYVGDTVNVAVAATDNLSGVWRYNIYAQMGDDIMFPIAMNIPADSVVSFVPPVETARFHSSAVDSAGNIEPVAPIPLVLYDTLVITTCDNFVWHDSVITTSGEYVWSKIYVSPNITDTITTLFLTVNYSSSLSETLTVCDSYTWNDSVYTESGDYTQTFTNASGCDSIMTLHLTVNYPNTGDTTAIACDSFNWYGTSYTSSGDYTHTQTNANGCDSVVTLHLTVNYSNTGDTTAVACDSFDWYGTIYTLSGNYTHTLTNANGCDSVVTLHLTINYSNTGDTTAVVCDSFDWYEHTNLSQSGEYTHTFTNAVGCDSVVTLHLTINYSNTGDTTAVVCNSFDWYEHTNLTQSGDYAHTFTNMAGCDSVVTLHLTINSPVVSAITASACDSYEWNGETYMSSGDYEQTFTAANGCDSVVTLHLTVNASEASEFTITTPDSCYSWNNIDYCTSGDYTQTLQTIHGCDSIVTLHLTITVGIDDHNLGASMTVYPNPTNDIINVRCTMYNVQVGTLEFHVFDAYGKLIGVVETRCTTSLQTAQIDLSRYAPGVYFVKAVADDKVVAVRKVVKR